MAGLTMLCSTGIRQVTALPMIITFALVLLGTVAPEMRQDANIASCGYSVITEVQSRCYADCRANGGSQLQCMLDCGLR